MAKYTVREFCTSLGLETTGADYIGAGIFLKVLCEKGVAKEVDRINTSKSGKGRKSVVYDVPETFTLNVAAPVAAAPVEKVEEVQPVEEPVVEEVEAVEPVVVEAATEEVVEAVEEPVAAVVGPSYSYDEGDDDEDYADAA